VNNAGSLQQQNSGGKQKASPSWQTSAKLLEHIWVGVMPQAKNIHDDELTRWGGTCTQDCQC